LSIPTAARVSPSYLLSKARIETHDNGTGSYIARALTNWGGANWVLMVDNVVSNPFVIQDDRDITVPIYFNPGQETHFIYIICLGWWGDVPPGAQIDLVRAYLEDDTATALEVEITTAPTIRGAYNDSDQLSNWSLSGLRRYTNCERVEEWSTRATLGIELTNSGGDYTVDLYQGTTKVATGTRTGNGTVTLSTVGNSGVSGSVDVAYSADLELADDAYVLGTWAKSFEIYDDSTLMDYAYDNGKSNQLMRRLDDLTAGSYSIRLKSVSDIAQTSSYGSATAATIPVVPPKVETAVYKTGNYTNTEITVTSPTPTWTSETAFTKRSWCTRTAGAGTYAFECTTAGTTGADEPSWDTTVGNTTADGTVTWTCRNEVTFNIYDSAIDEPTDLDNINSHKQTNAADGDTFDVTLDSLGSASAGIRRLQIFSVSSGVESATPLVLEIEYDASGDVLPAAPNNPTTAKRTIDGRTVTVAYDYDQANEASTPTTVKMWLVAEGGSPDWGSPDVSESIAAASNGFMRGTIEATAGSDGFFQWIVRVADSDGDLSPSTTLSDEIWLGTTADAVPTPSVEYAG